MDNKFLNKQLNLPMHSFNLEDLVQFAYNEASTEKTIAIRKALETDWELREKYEVIASAQKRLDTLSLFTPRKKSVDKILDYAEKATRELTTES